MEESNNAQSIKQAFLSNANIEKDRYEYLSSVMDAMASVAKETIEENLQDLTEGNRSYKLDHAEVDYLRDMAMADMILAVDRCSPNFDYRQQVSQEFQNMDYEQKRDL